MTDAEITALHEKAMDHAHKADREDRKAFLAERQCANATAKRRAPEDSMTRAILHKSAGYLALRCGEIEEAKRLAEEGLKSAPLDGYTAAQLRHIFILAAAKEQAP